MVYFMCRWFFFFQAEDGIRDGTVTGVKTCALPIWRRIEKAADLVAAGKMLALGAQHDDPDAPIGVEGLEGRAQLLAFGHRDDVEWRPVENDIGALARGIDLDTKAIEPVGPGGCR